MKIKAKAWDTERKIMFSAEEMGADQLTLMPDGKGFINVHGKSTSLSELLPHLLPLLYTGLKDKNGKEIYEGDIINQYEHEPIMGYDTVSFNEYTANWGYIAWNHSFTPFFGYCCHGSTDGGGIGHVNETDFSKVEVIGNIYENEELLKENNGEAKQGD